MSNATKEQIAEALYEVRHYHELARESFNDGDLESAEGWLKAIGEEVSNALAAKE